MNILLCGNEKVFDGALTELISITNKTKSNVTCYIFTMDLSRVKPEYTSISDKQAEYLDEVIKRAKEAAINGKITKTQLVGIINNAKATKEREESVQNELGENVSEIMEEESK